MRPTLAALAVALLALPTVLVLAPSATATVPIPGLPQSCYEQTDVDVMLVMDRSGSMTDQNRMVLAQGAASAFLQTLAPQDQSGLVSFASDVRLDKQLDTSHVGPLPSTEAKVNALSPGGGTQIWKGIRMAHYELSNHPPIGPGPLQYSGRGGLYGGKPVMIVLSDGDQNDPWPRPQDEAYWAKQSGTTVFSIVLGDAVSAAGRAEMLAVANSSDHYFEVGNGDPLNPVFLSIAARVRDLAPPSVTITRPALRLYDADVDVGPSPVSLPAINGVFTPRALAADDCLLDRVEFTVLAYDDSDAIAGIVPAGIDTTAPYEGRFDCDALAGGRHILRATAYDFDGKSATTTTPFYCIRAAVDARGTAMFARVTNPVGPNVTNAGAALPSPFGGWDDSVFANKNGPAPVPHDASALYDAVNGSAWLDAGAAHALSRVANVTLPSLPQHAELLETTAVASVDLVALQTDSTFTGHERLGLSSGAATPGGCTMLQTTLPAVALTPCLGDVYVEGDLELRWGERIVETREGFVGITVNGLRVLLDRPEGRAEIVLAQSFAAASFLGPRGLVGGPARATDAQSDAGSGADAPASPSLAATLAPGVYGGRIANGTDVDAYAFDVAIGEKLHVEIVPSHEANVLLTPGPGATPTAGIVVPRATLLDPALAVRDAKASLLGAPVEVELNVDATGRWVVLVGDAGGPGDYTLVATITPITWTTENDALLGVDAGEGCSDAALVGPGMHVGAIEEGDASDFYRVQVFEGQALVVALRPGDTVDAADMDLYVYDAACNLLGASAGVLLVKGKPEVVPLGATALGQPALPSGMYRIEVRSVSGLGSYQLETTTSVAVQWT